MAIICEWLDYGDQAGYFATRFDPGAREVKGILAG
jgi:hypothetical protein